MNLSEFGDFTVRLSPQEREVLAQLAKAKDLTEAQAMKQALRLYQLDSVRRAKKQYSLWYDADGTLADPLVGCPDPG